ncbi:ABC transporter substrate-binding protein [Izhakiella australiensis]|uniref:ABC transporter substrate-binding protein n=1 Tax=Izhakiella australiensis TaxID=1926881 RepID=UPI000BBD5640|nr:ABC transporter substrate-binding protein [Izhakiella australiensis]
MRNKNLAGAKSLTLLAAVVCGLCSFSAAAADNNLPDNRALLQGVQPDNALVATLPAKIRESGKITVGTFTPAAPGNFYAEDGTTIIGYEPDLIKAVLAKLKLQPAFVSMDFSALITSLKSKRINITMAQMNDTAERQKAIDFIDYLFTGITVIVKKGNPAAIKGGDDLCGHKVAVVTGTTQHEFAEKASADCKQQNKAPISLIVTDSDPQNLIQLRSGRIDAIINDLPTASYISRTTGKGNEFEVVKGKIINGAPFGIGINKDDTALRDALQKALQEIIDDGTYQKILTSWGLTNGALKTATVNGGK